MYDFLGKGSAGGAVGGPPDCPVSGAAAGSSRAREAMAKGAGRSGQPWGEGRGSGGCRSHAGTVPSVAAVTAPPAPPRDAN